MDGSVIEPPPKRADDLFKDIERTAPPGINALLMQFKQVAWKELNSYVHGGVHALANVGGVYLSAAGWDLDAALQGADDYGRTRSVYHRPDMDPVYQNIPAENVQNITKGYMDQRHGTMCTISGR